MKRRLSIALGLVLCAACAHDQEEDTFLSDGEAGEDEVADQSNATEQTSQDEVDADEEEVADEGGSASGGEDFNAMLAAMVEQQKKAGVEVPTKKPVAKAKAKPAATPTSEPSESSGSQPMWVFVDKAWVFAAADGGGVKVKQLGYGEKVETVSSSDRWVQLGDGQYMRAGDLTDRKARFGKKVVNKSNKMQPTAAGERKVKTVVLAVRGAPDLNAKIIGYRTQHTTVQVVKEGWNGWTQIGPGRYVRTKYLYSTTTGH